MLLTTESKRALRRLRGEQNITCEDIANATGLHGNTVRKIIKNPDGEEVKNKTYVKIMDYISKNY
ncbi:helix-turn-helix domain-containing protein [Lactococcus sp. DD01]|uniref:helix-turn-helix domain-containing protein n=1 Tax=Lactococcus sp. DD01 TaxID=1776443 RepID=UPI0007768C83|nr:helix-turn-helix domain-containing protein [Lactococcus sp. DD01]KXT61773.1 hypothetical protein LACDD01_01241 [Lactococcus sp. DD01]